MKKKKSKSPKKEEKTRSPILAISSIANAASVIKLYSSNYGDQDLGELIQELVQRTNECKNNGTSLIEQMLFNQAKALETIFSRLARMAAVSDFNQNLELYLRLALKAQSQCSRTLATLHSVKSPSSVSFVKQTNIGDNLQVNNHSGIENNSQKKIENSTNELLEMPIEKRMDVREKCQAVGPNSNLEPLEAVDGA